LYQTAVHSDETFDSTVVFSTIIIAAEVAHHYCISWTVYSRQFYGAPGGVTRMDQTLLEIEGSILSAYSWLLAMLQLSAQYADILTIQGKW